MSTERRDPQDLTEGLISVIVNLGLAIGLDRAIQLLMHHKYNTVPFASKHLGQDYHDREMEAYGLAIDKLIDARAGLSRPDKWKRVGGTDQS